MKRLPVYLCALILLGLVFLPKPPQASERAVRHSLDEQATTLSIAKTDDGVALHWTPSDTLHYWAVVHSQFWTMADPETLAVTSDTFLYSSRRRGFFEPRLFSY
jgi:hypothetical protein